MICLQPTAVTFVPKLEQDQTRRGAARAGSLTADDFPVEVEDQSEPVAPAETEGLADRLAEPVNEHAHQCPVTPQGPGLGGKRICPNAFPHAAAECLDLSSR